MTDRFDSGFENKRRSVIRNAEAREKHRRRAIATNSPFIGTDLELKRDSDARTAEARRILGLPELNEHFQLFEYLESLFQDVPTDHIDESMSTRTAKAPERIDAPPPPESKVPWYLRDSHPYAQQVPTDKEHDMSIPTHGGNPGTSYRSDQDVPHNSGSTEPGQSPDLDVPEYVSIQLQLKPLTCAMFALALVILGVFVGFALDSDSSSPAAVATAPPATTVPGATTTTTSFITAKVVRFEPRVAHPGEYRVITECGGPYYVTDTQLQAGKVYEDQHPTVQIGLSGDMVTSISAMVNNLPPAFCPAATNE